MSYSKELIQKTINTWQPYSKETLTEEDAREILYNTTEFFKILAEWDKKETSYA